MTDRLIFVAVGAGIGLLGVELIALGVWLSTLPT